MSFFFRCYFLLLPFQWALSPVEGVDLAIIRVISLLGACAWLALSLLRRRVWLPQGWAVLALGAFFLLSFLSLTWAENSVFALRKILFLFSFAPLFFILCAFLQEFPEERERVIRSYVWGAFLSALVGILFFLGQFVFGVGAVVTFLTGTVLPFFLGGTFGQTVATYSSLLVNVAGTTLLRASGVFPDPHMFSYYVGMAAPLAFGLALTAEKKRSLWWGMGFVLLLADFLSFSRGGYVGLLVSASIVSLLFFRSFFLSARRQALLGVGSALIVIFVLGLTPLGTRFTSIFSQEDGSNTERLRLWQEAVIHVGEHPILGVGLGNYPLLVKPGVSYREPIYAHNLFLDITLETGLLGLSLFFLACMCVITGLGQVFFQSGNPLALAVLASVVLFLGHSLFETPLFSVHVLPAFLLLIALGVSYRYHETPY